MRKRRVEASLDAAKHIGLHTPICSHQRHRPAVKADRKAQKQVIGSLDYRRGFPLPSASNCRASSQAAVDDLENSNGYATGVAQTHVDFKVLQTQFLAQSRLPSYPDCRVHILEGRHWFRSWRERIPGMYPCGNESHLISKFESISRFLSQPLEVEFSAVREHN